MFAVVGTAVSAGVVAGTLQIGGLLGWLDANLFGGVNTASGIHGSLLFASLISATDAVATLAILSSPEVNADPDLQATLFGESVLNERSRSSSFRRCMTAHSQKHVAARAMPPLSSMCWALLSRLV